MCYTLYTSSTHSAEPDYIYLLTKLPLYVRNTHPLQAHAALT
jgi:hypothetical protein